MTSETTSPFTTSPEQQFMLDVTRKKATSSSSPPRQDLSLDISSATSFKDALMHDMDVIEPTALSIHKETWESTMTGDMELRTLGSMPYRCQLQFEKGYMRHGRVAS